MKRIIMKRIILLSLLYFGLFGFNSVKSMSLDGVAKVGGSIATAVTVLELHNAYRCYKRYSSIPNTGPQGSATYSESYRQADHYESAMDHFKTALFTACLTGLALKKLKII